MHHAKRKIMLPGSNRVPIGSTALGSSLPRKSSFSSPSLLLHLFQISLARSPNSNQPFLHHLELDSPLFLLSTIHFIHYPTSNAQQKAKKRKRLGELTFFDGFSTPSASLLRLPYEPLREEGCRSRLACDCG